MEVGVAHVVGLSRSSNQRSRALVSHCCFIPLVTESAICLLSSSPRPLHQLINITIFPVALQYPSILWWARIVHSGEWVCALQKALHRGAAILFTGSRDLSTRLFFLSAAEEHAMEMFEWHCTDGQPPRPHQRSASQWMVVCLGILFSKFRYYIQNIRIFVPHHLPRRLIKIRITCWRNGLAVSDDIQSISQGQYTSMPTGTDWRCSTYAY